MIKLSEIESKRIGRKKKRKMNSKVRAPKGEVKEYGGEKEGVE